MDTVIAQVDVGPLGNIDLSAEAGLAEAGAVEAAVVFDEVTEGEVGEAGDGFDVRMAVAGFESDKATGAPCAIDGGDAGAGAVDEERGGVEVVIGLELTQKAPSLRLPLGAGGDGVIVLFTGGVKGPVSAAEFAVDAEAELLNGLEANPEEAGVEAVGLFGPVELSGCFDIFELAGANAAFREVVAGEEAEPARELEVGVGEIGEGSDAEVLEAQEIEAGDRVVDFAVGAFSFHAGVIDGGMVRDGESFEGKPTEGEVAGGNGAAGVAADEDLAILGGAETAGTEGEFIEDEVLLAGGVGEPGVDGERLEGFVVKTDAPVGGLAMGGFVAAELAERIRVVGVGSGAGGEEGGAGIVAEVLPAVEDMELGFEDLEFRAEAVLVAGAADVEEIVNSSPRLSGNWRVEKAGPSCWLRE